MLPSQEPKYGIRNGQIVNRESGAPIPDDEPIFVFRAKDRLAVRILTGYFSAIEDPEHARAVAARLEVTGQPVAYWLRLGNRVSQNAWDGQRSAASTGAG